MGYAKGLGGVTSLCGKVDHRDEGNTWGGLGVIILSCGGGNGSRRNLLHKRVH